MPTKTYYKPNRTKIRHFTTCDAARVAREVLRFDENTTAEEVLACIAKGLGFTHISLSRGIVQGGVGLPPAIMKNLPAILASARAALMILLKKYGWLLPIIKNILQIIDEAQKVVDWFKTESLPPQVPVDDVLNPEKCICKRETPKNRKLIGRS